MMTKSLAPVLIGALLLTASPAMAQSAAEKAQGGIGGYLAIMAIGQLCKFELDKAATEVIVGNINALQPKAKLSDADLDAALKGLIDSFGMRKDSPCAAGQAEYFNMAVAMSKGAEKEAEGSGVTLKAVPARPATAAVKSAPPAADKAKEAAKNLLIAAHMIEAVADECKIEISSKDSLDLDRVQYYFRGKADLSVKEVKQIVDAVEEEAKNSHKTVCAPEWGFKSTLKTMIDMIK